MSRRGVRSRRGWRKTFDPGPGRKGAVYELADGYTVTHCGHPTALWPYYGTTPKSAKMVLAPHGRAFKYLDEAQLAIEALYAEHHR